MCISLSTLGLICLVTWFVIVWEDAGAAVEAQESTRRWRAEKARKRLQQTARRRQVHEACAVLDRQLFPGA